MPRYRLDIFTLAIAIARTSPTSTITSTAVIPTLETETGEVIREMIPTQVEALKELADHRRALAA